MMLDGFLKCLVNIFDSSRHFVWLLKICHFDTWVCRKKDKMKEIERIQGKTLKIIFKLPVSTAYTGVLMETGILNRE